MDLSEGVFLEEINVRKITTVTENNPRGKWSPFHVKNVTRGVEGKSKADAQIFFRNYAADNDLPLDWKFLDSLTEGYQDVAEIIRQQIGGKALYMMGSKQLTSSDEGRGALGVKFTASRKANYMKIVLTNMDLYDITFYKIRGMDMKEVDSYTGVYSDMLNDIISDVTGLALSL